MKKIYYLQFIFAGLLAWVASSCDPEAEDYTAAGLVEGEGAYFAPGNTTSYQTDQPSGSFTVNVMRANSELEGTVNVNAQYSEGAADVMNVPASVNFAAGESVQSFTVSYDNLTEGVNYSVTLSVGEETPYTSTASQTFTVLYSLVREEWVVVSENAVLTDNLFSGFGVTNLTITDIVVEKEANSNQYRFRSPYDNSYFETVYGMPIFPADFEAPYIVLDGETYADAGYYIAPTALGFVMINGVGPEVNPTWNCFGSVAGNLQTSAGPIEPGDPSYPLGSFDAAKQMFDFGTCYFNIEDEGAPYYLTATGFELWLNPSLMETDYDRDFTWVDVPEAAGLFTSGMAGQSWVQAVQVAEEDPTFYRFPNLYASGEKTHLYFYLDMENDYSVNIPSGQNWTGLTSFGQTVWVEGVNNGSSFDPETGTLTLALNLYLADADGVKAYDLGQFTETFLWGKTSEFAEADITDYVGNWLVTFDSSQGGGQSLVSITQEDDVTLKVQGLSLMDPAEFDDTMYLDYDPASGQVSFFFQQMASTVMIEDVPYMAFVSPFDYTTNMLGMEGFIGGLTSNGVLKFTDAPTNEGTYNSMVYLVTPDGSSFSFLTGYWNYLEWEPYTETASTKPMLQFEAPKTFKPTLKQGMTPRRTYKPELKLQPQPAQQKAMSRAALDAPKTAFSLAR